MGLKSLHALKICKAGRWCLDGKSFRRKELKWKKWGVLWRECGW